MIGIIEEDDSTRKDLKLFLQENNLEVSFATKTADELLDNVPDSGEDIEVLLFSLYPEGKNNVEDINSIKEVLPDAKILVISSSKNEEVMMQTLEYGVDGYYIKRYVPFRLLEAVKETMQGSVYIEPSVARGLIDRVFPKNDQAPEKTLAINITFIEKYQLTNREVQIAEGLVKGKLYKEIAYDNRVSINTVRHYVKTLYKKIGVNNRQQLIRLLHQG